MTFETHARAALFGALAALALAASTASPARAAPSCAEGPQTVGETIVGTPCDDTIHAPRGITTVYGEGGNDTLYGGRGNDSLEGGEGNDRLYGGIGDDRLRGGPGDDMLSGGFGADSLDGEAGDDFVRGDATIDAIGDSGGGFDTLSFATGTAPGFPNEGSVVDYEGFPKSGGERGVYVDLGAGFANDGLAPTGGGVDEPLGASNFESFERVIGTAFSDLIVGSSADQELYGGGGGDVLLGGGGNDRVFGGADGDYCEGTTVSACEFSGAQKKVAPHDSSAIAVGSMAPQAGSAPALYLTGSAGADEVTAQYSPAGVSFELGPGSTGAFDPAEAVAGGCNAPSGARSSARWRPRPTRSSSPGSKATTPSPLPAFPTRPRRFCSAAKAGTGSPAAPPKTPRSTGPATTSSTRARATTRSPTTPARTISSPGRATTSSSPTRSAKATSSTAAKATTTPTGRTSEPRSRSTSAAASRS